MGQDVQWCTEKRVISDGGAHAFAGDNSGGVLGISQKPIVLEPTPLPSQRWKTISLGGRHGAGVGDAVSHSARLSSFCLIFIECCLP